MIDLFVSDAEIALFFCALFVIDMLMDLATWPAALEYVKGEDLDKTDGRSLNPPSKSNIAGYGKGGSGNAISGDEDACRTTLEVIDRKPDADAAGGTLDKTGCELRSNDNDKECRDAEEPDHFRDDVYTLWRYYHIAAIVTVLYSMTRVFAGKEHFVLLTVMKVSDQSNLFSYFYLLVLVGNFSSYSQRHKQMGSLLKISMLVLLYFVYFY